MSMKSVAIPVIALWLAAMPAAAVEAARTAVKVGFVTTLSGSGAAIGADLRDGFSLALKSLAGRLGDLPAQLIVVDDEGKAAVARKATDRLLRRDKVDFMSGIVASDVLLAVATPIFKSRTFYISAGAGPSAYAGERCSPYFFSVAAQNDAQHEAMGKYVAGKRVKRVVVVASDDADGVDAVAGFRRFFAAQGVDEIVAAREQSNFAGELAQIRTQRPEAVYLALPGEAASRFVRQFAAAGMSGQIQLYAAGSSADEDVIRELGATLLGVFNAAPWAHDSENAESRRFVADFVRAYGRLPSLHAAQGYDAALLIDAAVRDVKGRIGDKPALRQALEARRFKSVRGDFSFGANHYPVQNYYLRVVGRDANDRITNKTMGTVLAKHADAYAPSCAMP